ncbi:hypothetical protein LG326_03495 [Metaplanococcus flavidus]
MRTITALIESYDEIFGTKTQMKKLYKYIKIANLKVKLVFLLLPILIIASYVFFLMEQIVVFLILISFVFILPHISRTLIEKDLNQNELSSFRDFEKNLKDWKEKVKEKSAIDLNIFENTSIVEEIIKYEIEYELNKPTFLSHVATPTKNLMFPIASFIIGLYISEYVTSTLISNLLVLVIIAFSGVFTYNFMRFSYYEFTRINKVTDMLSLIHECKVRNNLNL